MSKPFIPIEFADIQWDGNLPYSILYKDIYHSAASSIGQSRYVFIDGNDLITRWAALPCDKEHVFTIGETGFGTGLNFLLTWSLWEQYAPKAASLHFISGEKHPFRLEDLARVLSNWPELEQYKVELLKRYPVLTPGNHHLLFDNGRVKLTLMLGDACASFEQLLVCGDSVVESQLKPSFIDAWYLDGFAPKKNEGMWTQSLFHVIAMLSQKGTTCATYTVASPVKLGLIASGFHLSKRKGYGVKRHMLTGYLHEKKPYHLKQRTTPWHATRQQHQQHSALILGGGLAGCFTAHSLANRGWKVTVVEAAHIGQGASANQRAVLFPKLSAFHSPFTEFMLSSFLYAHGVYSEFLQHHVLGELKGSLSLAFNKKEQNAQQCLQRWLSIYPELGRLVNAQQASDLAGIDISTECLYIPYSGWLNSPALCHYLLDNNNITVLDNTTIDSLNYDDTHWWLNNSHAPVLILANGYKINQFKETQYLPIKPIRGQMTQIASNRQSQGLTIPLCAEGHVVPGVNGIHHFGASYELGAASAAIKLGDDQENQEKLALISPIHWSKEVTAHWAGVRATTPDYLPLLGPLVKAHEFLAIYAGLASNSKRWIAAEAPCYPGLYACAGFGSRGLTTIPLSAEWLAALINKEMVGAPRHLLQAVSPARFLRRTITRGLY